MYFVKLALELQATLPVGPQFGAAMGGDQGESRRLGEHGEACSILFAS